MQDERGAGLLESCPDGIVKRVAGRTIAGRAGGNPHGTQAECQRLVDQCKGGVGFVQRHDGDSDEARIAIAELGHGAVVRRRCCPAHGRVRMREYLGRAERREHHLALEAKKVQRQPAFATVESAEGTVPFSDLVRQVVHHLRL